VTLFVPKKTIFCWHYCSGLTAKSFQRLPLQIFIQQLFGNVKWCKEKRCRVKLLLNYIDCKGIRFGRESENRTFKLFLIILVILTNQKYICYLY
jgi:hypothetical protein